MLLEIGQSPQSRTAGGRRFSTRAAGAVVLALIIGGCGGTSDAELQSGQSPASSSISSSTSPEPETIPPLDGAPGEADAEGPVLSSGYRPYHHRYTGYAGTFDPTAGDNMPGSIGDPPVPDGLGPLTILADIERFPVPCVRWHRTIVGVDAGEGPAAERVEVRVTELAAALHTPFREQFGTAEDCDGITGAAAIGESYQELTEVACALPDGPALRCFTLADFGMLPGIANGFLRHHQLVFDTTTGHELTLRDLFAAVDVEETEGVALVKDVIEELNGWNATVRQAIPTAEGLTFGFSPYEGGAGVDGSLDLFVPWEHFEEARGAR